MRTVSKRAWLLALFSAALQILIFPLPNLYLLSWVAVAPLLVALLHARKPDTLQLTEGAKHIPGSPWQGFLLGYLCGTLWFAGTCYWIYSTMHQYGGVNAPLAIVILILFSLYLGLYLGGFGLLICLLARKNPSSRMALFLVPFLWVGFEFARTRISGFPWDLLGITQVDNIPLARFATVTGVYGLSFEIMVVNAAFAAAFLVPRAKRKTLLFAALCATVVLQTGRWIQPPALPADRTALLVQQNIPILQSTDWTREYFDSTMRDLSSLSMTTATPKPDLIAWPESPAPFYGNDPLFRDSVSNLARQTQTWMLVGNVGIQNASQSPNQQSQIFNSAALVSPGGDWVSHYDKIHLVPFGEYLPFKSIFSFAGGLTKEVGEFTPGSSRQPLQAGNIKIGVFICYESIFPDEIRQSIANGAQVFVNISNDGWYGDSGAYAQHLRQARMRAVENARWLLRDTNTGVTSVIDPYGRITESAPRKERTALLAHYSLSDEMTFYTRHGDWFAWLCAIISVLALGARTPSRA